MADSDSKQGLQYFADIEAFAVDKRWGQGVITVSGRVLKQSNKAWLS